MNSEYYATQWILTLFLYELPLELSWKVHEAFLIKGWTVIYASVLAVLELFMSIVEKWICRGQKHRTYRRLRDAHKELYKDGGYK